MPFFSAKVHFHEDDKAMWQFKLYCHTQNESIMNKTVSVQITALWN